LANVLLLLGRVAHFFALGDGLLLVAAVGVPPTLTAARVVDGVVPDDVVGVDGKGVFAGVELEELELEEAGEEPLPPDTISDAFAQNAMRRSTLSAWHSRWTLQSSGAKKAVAQLGPLQSAPYPSHPL